MTGAAPGDGVLEAPDRAAFAEIAARFAATLRAGDVVALHGDLGAGKTTFVRAVVRALHGTDDASSPTFVFRQRYEARRREAPAIEHLDLYRLESPAEALELGLDDALAGDAIVFVEWPERLPDWLPPQTRHLTILGAGEDPRRLLVG